MANLEAVRDRIVAHEGAVFRQIRGKMFAYKVTGSRLVLNTTNQILSWGQIAEAVSRMPVRSTVPLQDLRGPSYLYGILMDPRIRQGDWS